MGINSGLKGLTAVAVVNSREYEYLSEFSMWYAVIKQEENKYFV
jgi:hypothetical protein